MSRRLLPETSADAGGREPLIDATIRLIEVLSRFFGGFAGFRAAWNCGGGVGDAVGLVEVKMPGQSCRPGPSSVPFTFT